MSIFAAVVFLALVIIFLNPIRKLAIYSITASVFVIGLPFIVAKHYWDKI